MQTELNLRAKLSNSWWPEAIASLLALGGVAVAILSGFHASYWEQSGSDFKTVYAASVCFRTHLDPYDFDHLALVFRANGVVLPASWYAHAPVYPPLTLLAILPLTAVSMAHAVYLLLAVSTLALALAAFVLARAAGEIFGLTRPWRMLLIALFAAFPVLSFGLEMCNVSLPVGALCIAAVAVSATDRNLWPRVAALATGLVVKPHLALWVAVALLLSRSRADRQLARRALLVFGSTALLCAGWMAAHGELFSYMASYRAMLHAEVAGGSMSATRRDLGGVASQITSFESLLGYRLSGVSLRISSALAVLAGFVALLALSWRRDAADPAARLAAITAWSAFGLIAMYHRAYDAVILMLILPYLLARLRASWRDPLAWTFALLSVAMGVGISAAELDRLSAWPELSGLAHLLFYRQAPLVAVVLLVLLLADMARHAPGTAPGPSPRGTARPTGDRSRLKSSLCETGRTPHSAHQRTRPLQPHNRHATDHV